jgi:hypothetical protein
MLSPTPSRRRAAALFALLLALAAALVLAGASQALIDGGTAAPPSVQAILGGVPGGDDAAADVSVAGSNIWFVGQSRTLEGDLDATLWRYDIAYGGSHVSLKTYDGPAHLNDGFYDVAVRGSNVYAVGATRRTATDLDLLVTRWTTGQTFKWAKRYGGAAKKDDSATDVAIDSKGNVVVCGTTTGANGRDWILCKYSAAGKRLWTWRYDGAGHGNDAPVEMVVDGGGNVYVTGSAAVTGTGMSGAVTVKLSPAGTKLWAKTYVGPDAGGAGATAIARCPRGGVYVGGWTATGATAEDMVVLRYASKGTRFVFNRFMGDGALSRQWLNDLAVASNGHVVGVGTDDSMGSTDGAFVQWVDGPAGSTPNAGAIHSGATGGGPGSQWWAAVATDAFGGVYTTGRFPGPAGEPGVLTRRRSIHSDAGRWSYLWYETSEREAAAIAVSGTTVAVCGKVVTLGDDLDQFIQIWRY